MKKICFVTTVHGTLKSFVLKLAEYLHSTGEYDVSFICNYDQQFASSLPEYIHYFPVSMKRGISLDGATAAWKMIKIFKQEKFDLVQYSTPNASFYAAIAAKYAKVRVRLYCQWGIAYVGFSGLKRSIFKLIEKIVCSLSTQVEPDSYGNLKFSHEEGLYPEHKGHVVGNGSACGVNLEKFDIAQKFIWRQEIRQLWHIPEDAFVVGYIGRITGDKGINELLQAAVNILEENTNAYLMLVGYAEKTDSLDQRLYAWANDNPRVLFCGRTTTVEKYLAAMDVYALPSYREGFGMVTVEAEAMGVPVIVSDIPGTQNAFIKNETGLSIPVKNAGALAEAIQKLNANRELRHRFGVAGRQYVEENFEQKKLFHCIYADRNQLIGMNRNVTV